MPGCAGEDDGDADDQEQQSDELWRALRGGQPASCGPAGRAWTAWRAPGGGGGVPGAPWRPGSRGGGAASKRSERRSQSHRNDKEEREDRASVTDSPRVASLPPGQVCAFFPFLSGQYSLH